jgi:hypothetical protein
MDTRQLGFRSASQLLATLATSGSLLLTACGETTASRPAVVFPSSEEVAQIPSRKPRADAFGLKVAPVESWSFEAVPAIESAPYDDPSPWGQLLREQVKAHLATAALSMPLRCAAQEMARFHLAKQALPTDSLRRFMTARCGVVAPSVSPAVASVTAAAGVPDERIAAQFRAELGKLLDARLSTGHHLVAAAVARDAQRVSFVALIADDSARLDPGTHTVDGKRQVTLRGTVRGEFVDIGALVNRGPTGTTPCVPLGPISPPHFAVQCELAPTDRFSWVEVIGRKREGVLLREVAQTFIYEGDGSSVAYTARHLGAPAASSKGQELTAALVDRLNGVRRDAGLAPLSLAAKQSAQNTRLAGTLIDAGGADDGSAELAAVGLLAGWNVEGLIRSGGFFMGVVAPERDATAWLDVALELPLGRVALLDPEARQIAVGPFLPDGEAGLGAAVTTYAFFDNENHAADEVRFLERLAAARRALGLPPPSRIGESESMRIECARVLREGKPPMEALRQVMEATVAQMGTSVAGYLLETNDLARVEIPKELLGPGPQRVLVGVTHHRAPGAAWGQYVVMVVLVGKRAELTASVAGPSRL